MNYPHTDVYCRIGVSKIHGVGVFAIVPIKNGTVIFSGKEPPTHAVPKEIVDSLPKNVQRLYHDFSVFNGTDYICPDDLGELSVGWFFNDADDKANVECKPFRSRTDGFNFVAARDIEEGEELTMNYNAYEKDYLLLHSKQLARSHRSLRTATTLRTAANEAG
jgi:SET domain-containing protein